MSDEEELQQEEEGSKEFRVPEGAIPWLDKKFARMVKVAKEVGAAPPTYKVLREEFEPHYEFSETEIDSTGRPKYVPTGGQDKFLVIAVEGEPPKLAGWKFVARLTPTTEGNIVSTIPGTEDPVPEEYRTAPPYCDYCEKSRHRLDSFLVRNEETGEYKQVGRNCLAKFLGYGNPERVARYASWFADLEKDIHDHSEDFLRSGRPPLYFDLLEFMSMVVAVAEEHGWVGKKQAVDYGKPASLYMVLNQLDGRWRQEMKSKHHYDDLLTPTEEQKQRALAAIEWAQSDALQPDTDYKHNLKISTASDVFHTKAAGVVSSLISFKRRCEETEREREIRQQQREEQRSKLMGSEFVGREGDRITLPCVQVVGKRELEGQYGRTDMVRMVDEDGDVIIWFASGDSGLEEGREYCLTCTVKRHETYQGIKQTIVTRCKVKEACEFAEPVSGHGKRRAKAGSRKRPDEIPSLSGVSEV